jgi:pyrimidine-specific ribonucleoside hydrolase
MKRFNWLDWRKQLAEAGHRPFSRITFSELYTCDTQRGSKGFIRQSALGGIMKKVRVVGSRFLIALILILCFGTRLAQAQGPAAPPRHVIIDTDPGVDDSFAILLALRSPDIAVDAITVVFGNVTLDIGTQVALRLVEVADRTDVPVARGAAGPLVRKFTMQNAHGPDGMLGQSGTFPVPKTQLVATPAVELMRSIIRKNPGKVSLIPIGPLTNVATLLREDPEIAGMIPQIVLMGGSISGGNMTPAAESNIWHDPEAAQIVFHSGIPIVMVGLDVTRKMEFKDEYVRQLEASSDPVAQAAGRLGRAGVRQTTPLGGGPPVFVGRVLHDPLAMAAFIDPSIIKVQKCHIEIETSGELTAGETLGYCNGRPVRDSEPQVAEIGLPGDGMQPIATSAPNADVAVDVDVAKYFQLVMPRLLGKAAGSSNSQAR